MALPTVAQVLADAVAQGHIPYGVVHATNKDGTFHLQEAAGNRGLEGSDAEKPLQADALFALASQTKLMTSIAAMQVVERGLIELDEDTSAYLPDLAAQPILKGFDENNYPILEMRNTPITLRNLLTHSTGCSYDRASPDLVKWRAQYGFKLGSGATMAKRFTYPLIFQPGTAFHYGPSIDWAGRLVENLTGNTLQEYMRTNIWQPLGIAADDITFFADADEALRSEILPTATRESDGKLKAAGFPVLNQGAKDCFGGHGASARLGAYLKIMQSLLADDGKLLKPDTAKQMFTSQIDDIVRASLQAVVQGPLGALFIGEFDKDTPVDWGLGSLIFPQSDVDRRKKGSLTWGGYYNTYWLIDPEANLALTFGTQLLPPGDKAVAEVISAVERAVYREAGVKF